MSVSRCYLRRYLAPALVLFVFSSISHGQVNPPIPDQVTGLSTSPTIRWLNVANALQYQMQVSYDLSFTALAFDDSTVTDTSRATNSLLPDTGYFWRVRAYNGIRTSGWSAVNRFYAVSGESVYTYKRPSIDGWALISMPIHMSSRAVAFILPALWNPTPCTYCYLYYYAGGYQSTRAWEPGRGYWIKNFGGFVSLTGTVVPAETVEVTSGWNLIGSISSPIPVSSITSIPPGIISSPFFGYNGGYSVAGTDNPMSGYWVKCASAGKLILSSPGVTPPKASIFLSDLERFNRATLGDARGRSQTFYFGNATAKERALSELPPLPPEGVDVGGELPKKYALNQNYPNPFNPSTTIRYELPSATRVRLVIYNTLGQEMSTLVDQIQGPGYESAEWNATDAVSGVYFYRLEAVSVSDPAETFTRIGKAILMK